MALHSEEFKRKREAVIERFGPWSAHNIHLSDDKYTFDRDHPDFEGLLHANGTALQRIVQISADMFERPINGLRVLDLACLEGMYGIEFARQGAEVVGIEGRELNIEKARFAAEALSLNNITFAQDDVRNLSVEKYGHFDIVLCLGILYHLNAPDVFYFMEQISEVCRRLLIIDTHVASTRAEVTHTFKGQEYSGVSFVEHAPGTSEEDKLKSAWASLDNEKSFWFTPPSLFNLLSNIGFTSAYTCLGPAVNAWPTINRHVFAAIKGEPRRVLGDPDAPSELWSEESFLGFHPEGPVPAAEQQAAPAPQGLRGKLRSAARRIIR